MAESTNSHLGKKILYSVIIAFCVLVILFSAASVIGAWVVQGPLGDSIVAILTIVEDTTQKAQESITKIDGVMANVQAVAAEVESASSQISQNITDQGLVLTLLPEEKEQELLEGIDAVRDTFLEVQEALQKALELYRTIDRLPFIDLPQLNEDQIAKIEGFIANMEELVGTLRTSIQEFRAGLTDRIGKIIEAASVVKNELGAFRNQLSELNAKLAALQALAIRLQEVIPGIFLTITLILTLVLAWIIYTQVEVILLYRHRWQQLGLAVQSSDVEAKGQLEELSQHVE
jgi:hypothetical protein